jgi:hypothetical protein
MENCAPELEVTRILKNRLGPTNQLQHGVQQSCLQSDIPVPVFNEKGLARQDQRLFSSYHCSIIKKLEIYMGVFFAKNLLLLTQADGKCPSRNVFLPFRNKKKTNQGSGSGPKLDPGCRVCAFKSEIKIRIQTQGKEKEKEESKEKEFVYNAGSNLP